MGLLTSQRACKKISDLAKKNGGSISAKEYRQIISKQKPEHIKKQKELKSFSFILNVDKLDDEKYRFVLKGRHISVNEYNSLSKREQIRYKNSIKLAFGQWHMTNRKERPTKPFSKAILKPIHYNKRSRDDDGGAISNKIIRDYIVRTGFMNDDTRKHIKQNETIEILQNEYKIVMILKKIENNDV